MKTRMCPRCHTEPSRRQIGMRPAYCEACRIIARQEQVRATTERRKRERAALRPPQPPKRMCPRCGLNPPRYWVPRHVAQLPMCLSCYTASRQLMYQRQALHCDDLPPAEIERRFTAALAQIRRRA
jgi:ribosomal protein S26